MPQQDLDLKNFQRPTSPNTYFAAPEGYSTVTPDEVVSNYAVDIKAAHDRWLDVIRAEPRTTIQQDTPTKIVAVQRSFLFRFPDVVQIELISLADNQSSFAIYSHSVYGHSDFGVNQKRVQRWLQVFAATMKY